MGPVMREADELRIAERAAYWLEVFERRGERAPGERERAEFMAWLEESPRHVRAFLLQQAWEVQTSGIDAGRQIDVGALLAQGAGSVLLLQSPAPSAEVQDGARVNAGAADQVDAHDADRAAPRHFSPHRHHHGFRSRRIAAGMAAALAVLLFAGWQLLSGETYSTAIGELRTVELGDGSTLQLGTRSTVEVDFSTQGRDIRLLTGEALFDVAPDATRPFRVHAGRNVIQAVGTQFTVNRRPLGTVVSVMQGAVRVLPDAADEHADTLLSAGEEVIVESNGRLQRREPAQKSEVVAWRDRRLVFRDDALADIAAEFNRYNRGTQIVVEGDAARSKRYGGIFDADDPEAIVRFVAQDPALTIRRDGGRIVIR